MFCKSKGVSTCTALILTGQAAAINFGWVRFMSYFLHDIVVLHEHGICGQYNYRQAKYVKFKSKCFT